MECGVAHVDGSSCGLEYGHKELHDFTMPPPDEYFEEDDGQIIIDFE